MSQDGEWLRVLLLSQNTISSLPGSPRQQSKLKIATQQEVHTCLQVGTNIQGYLTHTRVLSAAQTFFQVLKLTAGSCEMEQEWLGVIRVGGCP